MVAREVGVTSKWSGTSLAVRVSAAVCGVAGRLPARRSRGLAPPTLTTTARVRLCRSATTGREVGAGAHGKGAGDHAGEAGKQHVVAVTQGRTGDTRDNIAMHQRIEDDLAEAATRTRTPANGTTCSGGNGPQPVNTCLRTCAEIRRAGPVLRSSEVPCHTLRSAARLSMRCLQ